VTASEWTPTEMMIVASARQLRGERVCFVGVGPPNIACNLARRTVSPDLQLVYEAGVFGARPARLPLSIGDPTLATGSTAIHGMLELFAFYLQGGLIDVGFLGASQIDRFGTINTTVIGSYEGPDVRLPGSGGACEIAINAGKVFVIMPQSRRSFVERVDFVTSPGRPGGRRPARWAGSGPSVVVTNLGVYGFDDATAEMELRSVHPTVTVEDAREATSWPLRVADDVAETPPPTAEELRLIREELDPEGVASR
jgi:glutaconate CoA-transferase, subunit B